MKYLFIVDAQNDFISGSLKCFNSEVAVGNIVTFLQNNPACEVLYSLDWHSKKNKSYKINGGIWPVHCQVGTPGAQLADAFYKLKDKTKIPQPINMYYKGINDEVEEYSAFYARRDDGRAVCEIITPDDEIIIGGFAIEYCIKETINELLNHGFTKISLYKEMVGYVNQGDYEKALITLKAKGVTIY